MASLAERLALLATRLGVEVKAVRTEFVAKALADAKGDLFAASAADTVGRLAVGANDRLLIADSAQTLGLRWATPAEVKTALALNLVDNTSDATKLSAVRTLTNARITRRVVSAASTATLTVDSDAYDVAILTAQAAALAVANPTGTPTEAQALTYRFKDNGTARAITWSGSEFRSFAATMPVTTIVSKALYVTFWRNVTDTKWDCMAVGQQP